MADHTITLTHLNVRQSIAILLIKLILVDSIMAFMAIGFYFVLVQADQVIQNISGNGMLFLTVFGISGIIKIGLTIYITLQWINEYYEITPHAVIHKRGVVFRKSEKYNLDKIRAINVQDTFLGELCNYATITLYDLRLNKYLDMYLIHNPDRYARILTMLKPELETKTDRVKLPFMPKRERIDEIDNDKM